MIHYIRQSPHPLPLLALSCNIYCIVARESSGISSEESSNVQISTDFVCARAQDQSTILMLTRAKNIVFDSG